MCDFGTPFKRVTKKLSIRCPECSSSTSIKWGLAYTAACLWFFLTVLTRTRLAWTSLVRSGLFFFLFELNELRFLGLLVVLFGKSLPFNQFRAIIVGFDVHHSEFMTQQTLRIRTTKIALTALHCYDSADLGWWNKPLKWKEIYSFKLLPPQDLKASGLTSLNI